ncbi:putative alpha-1,6-mannanase (GH76 family) [Paenibacillus castaneae]|uniref:glycoside hydrolase family 76 protein n=1 Tax=Paenibacillus castaneae TaxID=474957 RepID=UPI001FBABA21|nr:glycoside hydrolase family 76 protein [Paenibacillus castaneae]NIK75295.1 putative alpha-1,6-mannanase (GH76 family) [Paenibacillus castaneae]
MESIIKTMTWNAKAEQAQRTLDNRFWNSSIRMYDILTPCPGGSCNTIFHYWWMAHAVETLVDGWNRTGDSFFKQRLSMLHQGILTRNGGEWPNNLYDDMEWMAIGWLRAYEIDEDETYKQTAETLWEDIKTGWNEVMGGGIAWQKTQLDYKNTPANAPASILAARFYKAFGRKDDLEWAIKIYDWQKEMLVDPETGFVWDGLNRLGDGVIDKDWKFTYCQGVFIGAAVELYGITGDKGYLEDAKRTWHAAIKELAMNESGLMPAEGGGDAGLFKGIFVRYAGELAQALNDGREVAGILASNSSTLWSSISNPDEALFGKSWDEAPTEDVELSTQLSGVILLETAALLEKQGLL